MRFKNVFVLCTGRCGSLSFAKACEHIEGYTAGHETNTHVFGAGRCKYPDYHIEVDNRLIWHSGQLGETYRGNETLYVWLSRDTVKVAESYAKRYEQGRLLMSGWIHNIHIPRPGQKITIQEAAFDMVVGIQTNIGYYLKGKDHVCVNIDDYLFDWYEFVDRLGVRCDNGKAKQEFERRYNAS